MLSEEFLQTLIMCPKSVLRADRRKMTTNNRHLRNNVYLSSVDGAYQYRMFMRQSEMFIEDFSIGLTWINPNEHSNILKDIILFRCQGPHDGKMPLDTDVHHSYHTHEITIEDIEQKRYKQPSNREGSTVYGSFSQALLYFISRCNIMCLEDFIEMQEQYDQISLF